MKIQVLFSHSVTLIVESFLIAVKALCNHNGDDHLVVIIYFERYNIFYNSELFNAMLNLKMFFFLQLPVDNKLFTSYCLLLILGSFLPKEFYIDVFLIKIFLNFIFLINRQISVK